MNRAALLATVSYLMLASMDGELSGDEIITAAETFLKNSGVDMEGEFFDIFTEADGDLHVIIKSSLIKKLDINI